MISLLSTSLLVENKVNIQIFSSKNNEIDTEEYWQNTISSQRISDTLKLSLEKVCTAQKEIYYDKH